MGQLLPLLPQFREERQALRNFQGFVRTNFMFSLVSIECSSNVLEINIHKILAFRIGKVMG